MKVKVLTILILFFLTCLPKLRLNAQVTIGSDIPPEKAALLELKTQEGSAGAITSTKGGLLLPRVKLNDLNELDIFESIHTTDSDYEQQKLNHAGLTIFNTERDGAKNLEKGVYVWNGEKWERASYSNPVNFFYMPSIVIDTRTTGSFTVNLYQEYVNQFQNPAVRSNGAPISVPFYTNPEDFYYYITDYDRTVFANVNVDEKGVMEYDIVQPSTEGTSFMNIVFVIK